MQRGRGGFYQRHPGAALKVAGAELREWFGVKRASSVHDVDAARFFVAQRVAQRLAAGVDYLLWPPKKR